MEISQKNKILESITNFNHFLNKPINNLGEIYDFLDALPVFITNFIKDIEHNCNSTKFSKQKHFSVLVHLTQYCSYYDLFKNAYSRGLMENETLFEIKRCVCKQIKLLLDNAPVLLFNNKGDTTVGSFLTLMDLALDKIAEIDINQGQESIQLELNVVSSVTEEILCLSMSVAQVAFDDDNKIITAGCRSVLNAIESLKTEINQKNPNVAICNLVIDTFSDKLCAFEARVNTAVLRLCLKVFSEYQKPIKTLYDFCVDLQTSDNAALDALISEFDLHTDRIFQIGWFSIASSIMGKRVADIKNIMANLEFLEGELVPAFLGMTKNSPQHRKIFADILKKSWCTQVKLLRKAVHSIIEPSAYCKVVYEELKQKVDDLWQQIDEKHLMSSFSFFVSYTKELGQMFTECMDSFESSKKSSIKKQLEIIHKVLNELIAARDLLLSENSKKSCNTNERVFKRCRVLLVSIKRLWLCTTDGTQENQLLPEDEVKNQNTRNTKTHIENPQYDNSTLNSIMIKSRQLLKDRSVFHVNSNGVTSIRALTENAAKQPNGGKLIRLTKNKNLRECSYRQHKTFVERNDNISMAEQVFSRIQSLKY